MSLQGFLQAMWRLRNLAGELSGVRRQTGTVANQRASTRIIVAMNPYAHCALKPMCGDERILY